MKLGLEFGCRAPLQVRRERVVVARAGPAHEPWRALYVSDLHLTARRTALAGSLAAVVRAERPDVVLLGGDLIDRSNGLPVLGACVRELAALAPVFAVAGNHDAWLGLAAVRAAVRAAGGHWLHDGGACLERGGRPPLHLHARARPAGAAVAWRVLVGHHPATASRGAACGYDLVLAGHLHGGQCVLWQRGQRLFPGAWFSRWNGLRFQVGGATLLVSRGAADTLPVRFRCPREALLCELGAAAVRR